MLPDGGNARVIQGEILVTRWVFFERRVRPPMIIENAVQQLLKNLPSAASATFLALFPIVNPFGGVSLFFSLTSTFPAADRSCRGILGSGVQRTGRRIRSGRSQDAGRA